MDATPPPIVAPAPAPAPAPAAPAEVRPAAADYPATTDMHPRGDEERRLCAKASHPDYLYLAGLVAIDALAVGVHPMLKQEEDERVSALGPAFIGLAWGATLGGGAIAMASCDPNWVVSDPPEGGIQQRWPLALALAGISAASAPFVVGIVTGGLPAQWDYGQRARRLYIAAAGGLIGALLPRIPWIAPIPFRASLELEKLRVIPTEGGVAASYTLQF